MTIQRTYNLPNCTLLIEGISPGDSGILSILTNFECRFHHTQDKQSVIAGGRKLLDALVESVGQYAQNLSGGNVVAISVAPVRLEPGGVPDRIGGLGEEVLAPLEVRTTARPRTNSTISFPSIASRTGARRSKLQSPRSWSA
ncbi:MAG: DUF4335 domain-containing protein [Pseudanabaena sp. SU_2_4]|nr:DUF4335 domain-containing protein [Pseudanabaena sp. SU_2_4]